MAENISDERLEELIDSIATDADGLSFDGFPISAQRCKDTAELLRELQALRKVIAGMDDVA